MEKYTGSVFIVVLYECDNFISHKKYKHLVVSNVLVPIINQISIRKHAKQYSLVIYISSKKVNQMSN